MSSVTKTYVSALYCVSCNTYFKGHKNPEPCPKCGNSTKWKCVLKGSKNDPRVYGDFANIAFKENVRVSRSMGVPIEQFKEARAAHPGVEWKRIGNSMDMEEYPPNLFGQIDEKSKWENRKRR
jgi:predicted RNA-binding Zn-ribbon protein involved in translation (DUF1610 family)